MNQRADTTVGKELKQQGMWYPAIDDGGRAHTIGNRLEGAVHFGQHAAMDGAISN